MGDLKTLIDMGFSKERAEYALNITNNAGVEPAMEWLLAHINEDIAQPDLTLRDQQSTNTSATLKLDTPTTTKRLSKEIKSFKCNTCGKVFTEKSEMEYHAIKSGHTGFSESTEEKKPLSDEEKREQLTLIEEKLKVKRIEREERERIDAVERERNRIRSGKDMSEARRRLEEMEMKKMVEQRKREKAEEKAARERVRKQIEADKMARKSRVDSDTSPTSGPCTSNATGLSSPESTKTDAVSEKAAVTAAPPPKQYTETRIQVRLQDGSVLMEKFNVKEQLSAVRVYIQLKAGLDVFGLMTTFPRKLFIDEDYEKPLEVLGLVPSAVLIVTKPPE